MKDRILPNTPESFELRVAQPYRVYFARWDGRTAVCCGLLKKNLTTFSFRGTLVPRNLLCFAEEHYWITRNGTLLVSTPVGVVTVTYPFVAPSGTVAVKYVSETTLNAAGTPLIATLVVPVNP
jgi:hypothetical protein